MYVYQEVALLLSQTMTLISQWFPMMQQRVSGCIEMTKFSAHNS